MAKDDKYSQLRNFIQNYDVLRKELNSDEILKDPFMGPTILMMEMIRQIDAKNEKIKKLRMSIEKKETKLIPLIKQVLEKANNELMISKESQLGLAGWLTESYDKYIQGHYKLEQMYTGPVPTEDKCVNIYATLYLDKHQIGKIESGVFTPISIMEFSQIPNKKPFDFFLKTKDDDNSLGYTISPIFSIDKNQEYENEVVIVCQSSDGLIEDHYQPYSFDDMFR